jgi:hypothetical protein
MKSGNAEINQEDDSTSFSFLFIEPESEPPDSKDSFDPMEIVSKIGGKLQPTGKRDKIIVFHSVSARDVQAEEIVAELASRGEPVFYLDTTAFLNSGQLSIELGQSKKSPGLVQLPSGNLDLNEVKSVWFRGPGIDLGELKHQTSRSAGFMIRESEAVLRGMMGVLDQAFWMNHPTAVWVAQEKLTQLCRAEALGLTIPRTLVTNEPRKARDFFEECRGEIILKTFSRLAYIQDGREYLILTNRVLQHHLNRLEKVRAIPCLFQEYIPKDIEVRVTIIGRNIFAAEIHSQSSPLSKDDYRRFDLAHTPYKPHELPKSLETTCLRLMDRYGLSFGAIDFIRRPDGEYVFLEINANAQFLWVQDLTGMPLRESVADVLVRGSI